MISLNEFFMDLMDIMDIMDLMDRAILHKVHSVHSVHKSEQLDTVHLKKRTAIWEIYYFGLPYCLLFDSF